MRMIDRSITTISLGGIISLWLWLIILDFIEGTDTMSLAPYQTEMHTHTPTHIELQTFHDIIGFIRSRPEQECGLLAGITSTEYR